MKAFYFAKKDSKLRHKDGREAVVGKMHTVNVLPKLCQQGLHGSVRAIDALSYAPPDPIIYRVEITRHLDVGDDKICGQRRKYLAGFDASELLKTFARKQAMINVQKIKPYCKAKDYNVIMQWLNTGEEQFRDAAEYAARSATKSATRFTAEAAAWSVAWSATRFTAEYAAWYAARHAARHAAEYAARYDTEYDAEYAARHVAWLAAWLAAEHVANQMLEDMIFEHLKTLGYEE